MSDTVFDAHFYQTVLLDRVAKECQGQPQQVPAVLLFLSDGSRLDICHITACDDTWLGVAYFRDTATCEDMDLAYVPYKLVTRVTVSLHHPQTRRLGFDVAKSRAGADAATDRELR